LEIILSLSLVVAKGNETAFSKDLFYYYFIVLNLHILEKRPLPIGALTSIDEEQHGSDQEG
jgi:hypothetical protein